MLCDHCGKAIQGQRGFCPYCGATVSRFPEPGSPPPRPARGPGAKPPRLEPRPRPAPRAETRAGGPESGRPAGDRDRGPGAGPTAPRPEDLRPPAGRRGPRRRKLFSFWQALVVLVIAMLVAGLLMAQPLDSAAKDIESGTLRALARVVTAPLAAISGALRIDKFYEWANGDDEDVVTTDTTGTTSTTDATTTTDGGTGPATTTTTPAKPVFTAEDPLKIYLAGDSLMIEVGHAFTRRSESLASIELFKRNPVGSGFADFSKYDWPKQLTKDVGEFKPDVTVMLIGGNDKVPMTVNGVKVQPFSAEWNAEYVKRVQAGIDITTNTGAIVVWVGMPSMRSDQYSETARTLNAIYEQICEDDPDAYYLDGYELFSDANGEYSAYLIDSDGKNQLVREDDGIHFTPAGGDRVVEAVLELLAEHFSLE